MSSFIFFKHVVEETDLYKASISKSNMDADHVYDIVVLLNDKVDKQALGIHPLDNQLVVKVDISTGTLVLPQDGPNHIGSQNRPERNHDGMPVYTQDYYQTLRNLLKPVADKHVSAENLNRLNNEIAARQVAEAQRKVTSANRALERMLARQAELMQR